MIGCFDATLTDGTRKAKHPMDISLAPPELGH